MKILFISLMLVFTMWSEALGLTYSNTTDYYDVYYEVQETSNNGSKLVYLLFNPTGKAPKTDLLITFFPTGNFCYVHSIIINDKQESIERLETLNDHIQFLLIKNLIY